MSQTTICDGCGEVTEATDQRGRIRALDYCACCAPAVDDYLAKLAALRREQAAVFAERLAELRVEVEGKCKKLRLPL